MDAGLQGVTYRFRDPHRGEVVAIHTRGQLGGPVVPDPKSRDLNLGKRVIGIPGDTVVGRQGRVFVNGRQADNIPIDPFPPTRLGDEQYFVGGDNRRFSQDSRVFGPVPRDAIWPVSSSPTGRSDESVHPGTTRISSRLGRCCATMSVPAKS